MATYVVCVVLPAPPSPAETRNVEVNEIQVNRDYSKSKRRNDSV